MYIVGEEEIEAIARVIRDNALFRYGIGSECDRFEARYAALSRRQALRAGGERQQRARRGDDRGRPRTGRRGADPGPHLHGDGDLGARGRRHPGDRRHRREHHHRSPKAIEAAIGPRTRAVVPVHMWGAACDMDAIMDIAARRNLIVIEDACQGVGGGYKGTQVRLGRPYRRVQLQLLQEHDLRAKAAASRSTTTGSPSGRAAPSTPATSTGTAATRRRSPSPATAPGLPSSWAPCSTCSSTGSTA